VESGRGADLGSPELAAVFRELTEHVQDLNALIAAIDDLIRDGDNSQIADPEFVQAYMEQVVQMHRESGEGTIGEAPPPVKKEDPLNVIQKIETKAKVQKASRVKESIVKAGIPRAKGVKILRGKLKKKKKPGLSQEDMDLFDKPI
jgi:hypothetical protein